MEVLWYWKSNRIRIQITIGANWFRTKWNRIILLLLNRNRIKNSLIQNQFICFWIVTSNEIEFELKSNSEQIDSELNQIELCYCYWIETEWRTHWFRTNSFAIGLLLYCYLYVLSIVFLLLLYWLYSYSSNFLRRCALLTRIAIVLLLYCYCNAFVWLWDSYGIGNQIKSNRIRIKIKIGANWFRTKSISIHVGTYLKAKPQIESKPNQEQIDSEPIQKEFTS